MYMRILAHELRKIWNPALLALLALLGALYYLLFPSYYMKDYGYGASGLLSRQAVYEEWAERYGPTLEPEERAELEEQLAAEQARFTELVVPLPFAAEWGITDWDSFAAFVEERFNSTEGSAAEDRMAAERIFWGVVDNTNYFRVDAVATAIEWYDNLAQDIPPNLNYDGGDPPALAERKLARIDALKASPLVHGYLPMAITNSLDYIVRSFIVWSLLSTVLLLSPTLVRDRLQRTRPLQWSSRRGRGILGFQFLAAGLSATVLWLLNLTAYALPYLAQGPLLFQDFPLFSFLVFSIPWYDWSFGTYLWILALLTLVLSLAAAGLTVFLSQYSRHYVAMLLKALPLFAALGVLCANGIMNRAFFFGNPVSRLLERPGVEVLAAAALALLSVALRMEACFRQRRGELAEAQ